jgi:hypothetical protein
MKISEKTKNVRYSNEKNYQKKLKECFKRRPEKQMPKMTSHPLLYSYKGINWQRLYTTVK